MADFAYVQDTSSGGRIIVETQSSGDTGTHDMILSVFLPEHDKTETFEFKVTIEACVVYDIHVTQPGELHLFYNVGDLGLTEPIPETFLTPEDCG